jgi:hypothetical protein
MFVGAVILVVQAGTASLSAILAAYSAPDRRSPATR